MDPAGQYITLVILLLLSAFFSSAETALTTVNKLRIRTYVEDHVKGAKTISKLIEKPEKMLSAILIGNNVVNISASSLATTIAVDKFGSYGAGIATGILTLVVLVFGEITPKSVATKYSERLSFVYAPFILALTVVLTPVIYIVNFLSNIFIKMFGKNVKENETITEDELMTMVEVSHEEGVIETDAHEMITNVMDFGDAVARDVMVPKVNMAFVSIDISYNDLVAAFEKDMYSRLPVYEGSTDNVVGIINLKDVFFYKGTKKDFSIKDFMREPFFTYESKKTTDLLHELKKSANPLAIVLDEYGATAGLVTIEDLVEEIVGDIRDEYDTDEVDNIVQSEDGSYIVDGLTNLSEINDSLKLNIESDDYDSIAGHVIFLLGHLPNQGEEVEDEQAKYTVLSTEKNRISKLRIDIKEISETNEED